jgi:signal peptidase I
LAAVKSATATNDDVTLRKQMANLEEVANKWLKPYPNAAIRENVEVLLVALAVALGIRTFFLQPFKIPTGSMQPTLWGVNYGPLPPNFTMPGAASRFVDYWINGNSYFNVTAPEDGELEEVKPPTHVMLFNLKQDYEFNGRWYSVWFPPDDLFVRAGLLNPRTGMPTGGRYRAGDPLIRMKVVAGDHLFVDRMSYNFRHPSRGDIIVFETHGIASLPPDEFYIKRLVGLPGEKVQIGDDRHLVIDGRRLDSSTPHFVNVYGFDPNSLPQSDKYSGHANGHSLPYPEEEAPHFLDANAVYNVDPGHYLAMGDNTMNSSDSRVWGELPQSNVIGKYFFVYWPFSTRFGWKVQ